ncbi:MAG TPA: hypothetical protein VNH20_04615 [Candidatus Dormibacteraeota bacterium]|nr:hypothetical protein [Candidatus Dormibacteraeota bacterium]
MSRRAAQARLLFAIEWICHTLWLAQRREPELLTLQEERGSTGFPHYILSRAGILPDQDWTEAIYVLPGSLVDHLRGRCLALGPSDYFQTSVAAGAAALRRLAPSADGSLLGELARGSRPQGRLPQAWHRLALPAGSDQELLWAAMTLRENRARAHYRGAAARGLDPLSLLVVSEIWRGRDPAPVTGFFRWGRADLEASLERLRDHGWLDPRGGLTAAGRARREALELETDDHTIRLLAPLPDRELDRLVAAVPDPQARY